MSKFPKCIPLFFKEKKKEKKNYKHSGVGKNLTEFVKIFTLESLNIYIYLLEKGERVFWKLRQHLT